MHTTTNNHPPNAKINYLPNIFLKIILAAYWLVRHSSILPPNSSNGLCFLFCLILLLWEGALESVRLKDVSKDDK